jgi:Lon protease-like protein
MEATINRYLASVEHKATMMAARECARVLSVQTKGTGLKKPRIRVNTPRAASEVLQEVDKRMGDIMLEVEETVLRAEEENEKEEGEEHAREVAAQEEDTTQRVIRVSSLPPSPG